jgi:hypothetical protein
MMARTCHNCGQKLRARDKYCSECGVPVGHVATSPRTQEWEYCEVMWSARGFLTNDKSYFWAQDIVTGDQVLRSPGTFQPQALTETRLYPADDQQTRTVLDEFTDQLKDAGWEPLATSGGRWWNQRFRRKIVG